MILSPPSKKIPAVRRRGPLSYATSSSYVYEEEEDASRTSLIVTHTPLAVASSYVTVRV